MADYIPPQAMEYKLGLGRVPEEPQEGVLWRGMSGGEYKNLLEQGFLESKGEYNIGDTQKGLTIFSEDPRKAEMYAHDFAPRDFKALPESSAYVVGIKKPEGAIQQNKSLFSPGRGEFGVRGQIPLENIIKVYRGNVFKPKSDRSGAVLDWQEIAASDFLEPRTTDQSNLPDVISDPSKDPNKSPKSKGSLFRGIGKLAQSRIFPLIQMAQGAYGALSEEQKSEISNFLDKPAYELVGMEKPGLEYFKDLLLGEKPSTEVSETPAENLMKFSPRTTELSKEALDAFKNVSDTQRGRPELAMVQLQKEGSANELNGVVEHIGDLTHVLTNEAPHGSFRRERVLGKIAGQINTLDRPDDVINNFLEQGYESAADFSKRDVNEVRETSERLLKQYAEEHKKVPVYNRPQFFAREAAVAVGEKRYSDAVDYLKKLRSIAEDPVEFQQAASAFIKPKLTDVTLKK